MMVLLSPSVSHLLLDRQCFPGAYGAERRTELRQRVSPGDSQRRRPVKPQPHHETRPRSGAQTPQKWWVERRMLRACRGILLDSGRLRRSAKSSSRASARSGAERLPLTGLVPSPHGADKRRQKSSGQQKIGCRILLSRRPQAHKRQMRLVNPAQPVSLDFEHRTSLNYIPTTGHGCRCRPLRWPGWNVILRTWTALRDLISSKPSKEALG